ncbi:MAG TPA: alkaline phosphatase family protein [Terriglobales bacterium]|nr:alkaline phosphatase family protein [Terriglobales bacterium]
MTPRVFNTSPDRATAVAKHNGASTLSIFVLIDALGWKYLEGREFLDDLLPYRTPLRTVLGFSSGAIPTILTGEHPSKTGHWNLFYYDPENSPFGWVRHLQFLPDRILDNRISRKLIQETGKRLLGLGPLFDCAVSPRLLPWFNWVERRNIYDEHGIVGAPSIFDQLSGQGIPYRVYTYHHGSDAHILRQVESDLSSRTSSFFFVYLSEMDMFLHLHCNEPASIGERIRWYESQLRKLFALAQNIDQNATFTVISDHGMTPVRNKYDILGDIESLHLRTPDDYLAVYDSTMARFWFFNEFSRSAVHSVLQEVSCGHVLSQEELRRFGVWFEDRRFGEAIFLLDPGWLFSRSDFNGTGWSPAGMHGYHPDDDRYSDAIFLSNQQPGFPMQTIKDVYACMTQAIVSTQ